MIMIMTLSYCLPRVLNISAEAVSKGALRMIRAALFCNFEILSMLAFEVDHTKTTRSDEMPSRWSQGGQDGLTNSIRKRTFARSSGKFLTCQIFWRRSRSCCRSLRKYTGVHKMA